MTKIMGAENYTVCGFMSRALGLSGAELQVYAVIYSFSRDGIGTFSGSKEYLARTVGFSVRTVERALKDLTERGLVFRSRCRADEPFMYVTNSAMITRALEELYQGRQNVVGSHRQNVATGPTKCRKCTDKMSPNNKEDNKEIINTPPPPPKSAQAREEKEKESDRNEEGKREEEKAREANESVINDAKTDIAERSGDDESDEFDWDEDELIIKVVECPAFDHFVTAEQYRHLKGLVGERLLRDYFGRLDAYMCENRNARPHSVYRTLLKWIKEDFGS